MFRLKPFIVLTICGVISLTHGLIAFENQTRYSKWKDTPHISGCIKNLGEKLNGNVDIGDEGANYDGLITQAGFYDADMVFSSSFRNLSYENRMITFGDEKIKLEDKHVLALIKLVIDAVQGKIGENPPVMIKTDKNIYVIDIQRKTYPLNEIYYFVVKKTPLEAPTSELKQKSEQARTEIQAMDDLLSSVYFLHEKSTAKIKASRVVAGGVGGVLGFVSGAAAGAILVIPCTFSSFLKDSGALEDVKRGYLSGYVVVAPMAVASVIGTSVTMLPAVGFGAAVGANIARTESADAAESATKYLSSVSEGTLGLTTADKEALAGLIRGDIEIYCKTFEKEYGDVKCAYRTTFTFSKDTIYMMTVYVENLCDPRFVEGNIRPV